MTEMTPAQFLAAITEGGRVNICSIVPDGELSGGIIRVDTKLQDIEAWAQHANTNAGLYYSLNEPLPGLKDKKKLTEDDVAAFRGIVLDIDPDEDEER